MGAYISSPSPTDPKSQLLDELKVQVHERSKRCNSTQHLLTLRLAGKTHLSSDAIDDRISAKLSRKTFPLTIKEERLQHYITYIYSMNNVKTMTIPTITITAIEDRLQTIKEESPPTLEEEMTRICQQKKFPSSNDIDGLIEARRLEKNYDAPLSLAQVLKKRIISMNGFIPA